MYLTFYLIFLQGMPASDQLSAILVAGAPAMNKNRPRVQPDRHRFQRLGHAYASEEVPVAASH